MATFRVAITDHGFPNTDPERAAFDAIDVEVIERQCVTEDEVIATAAGCAAILCDASPITRRVLTALPDLRVVSEYGIGVDNIDIEAATSLGVWVANVPGFCTEEVANHTFTLLLAAARRLLDYDRAARTPGWRLDPTTLGITRLSTQTLGLVGFGRIARAVAARAAAFGLRVLAWSPSLTREAARAAGAERSELDTLIEESDYLALHVPATPQTRGLIDSRRLAMMKPTAWLINTGRGALVDEDALADAIESGRLAGAALDVRRLEPPTTPDRLATLPNVILTPHRAYYSRQSLLDLQVSAARNVVAALTGTGPNTPVNRPSRLRQ